MFIGLRADINLFSSDVKNACSNECEKEIKQVNILDKNALSQNSVCNLFAIILDGPKKIWFEPNKTLYNYGEEIQCFADGNPPPIFTWNQVSGNFKQENNSILTLNDDLSSNSIQSFQCTAFNSFSGLNISKIIDVRIESNGTERGCCGRYTHI